MHQDLYALALSARGLRHRLPPDQLHNVRAESRVSVNGYHATETLDLAQFVSPRTDFAGRAELGGKSEILELTPILPRPILVSIVSSAPPSSLTFNSGPRACNVAILFTFRVARLLLTAKKEYVYICRVGQNIGFPILAGDRVPTGNNEFREPARRAAGPTGPK